MKLCVLNPVEPEELRRGDQELINDIFPDLNITVEAIKEGPKSIETRVKEAIVIPEMINLLKEIKNEYDGFVINCFVDPGLDTLKELTDKPVLGCGKTSFHTALTFKNEFSILTVKPAVPQIKENLEKYGLNENLRSLISTEIPVLELENSKDQLIELLYEENIERDTEILILGCTGMAMIANEMKKEIEMPVLEPLTATIYQLRILLKQLS